MGLNREDAMIKCLAESYERYTAFMFDYQQSTPSIYQSYNEIKSSYSNDLLPKTSSLSYFSNNQFKNSPHFKPFNADEKMCWLRLPELTSLKHIWLPAHLLILGYSSHREKPEPRLNGAVSTGNAVHRDYQSCILNSLLELILIDTTIGHWYCDYKAYKINFDQRTKRLEKIVNKSIPLNNIDIEFYWLPNPDFSVFNIACVAKSDAVPKFCVGLGSDTKLEKAMYKAYLELSGTRFLANTLAVLKANDKISDNISNLDDNVFLYANGKNNDFVNRKFDKNNTIKANEIPGEENSDQRVALKKIIESFRESGKQLAFLDYSNEESQQLGLVATKLWSPDLLTLPLPNSVPINHPRFNIYGGVKHVEPHPYP
ncbi:MAG: YcaO-like family protein [Legionellales bacterium]|nr:YcaO-like family protein [Legionellales bacterium]